MVARRARTFTGIVAILAMFSTGCIHAQTTTPRVTIVPAVTGESGIDVPTFPSTAAFPKGAISVHGAQGKEFFIAYSYGVSAYPGFYANKIGGTEATPTATPSGSHLGGFFGGGYTGSAISGAKGWFAVDSSALWSGTSTPTELSFATTPIGSTAIVRRWVIGNDGTFAPVTDNAMSFGDSTHRPFATFIKNTSLYPSVGGGLAITESDTDAICAFCVTVDNTHATLSIYQNGVAKIFLDPSGTSTITPALTVVGAVTHNTTSLFNGTVTLGSGVDILTSGGTADIGDISTPFTNGYFTHVVGVTDGVFGLLTAASSFNTPFVDYLNSGTSPPSNPASGYLRLYYGQTSGAGRAFRYFDSAGTSNTLFGTTNTVATYPVTITTTNGIATIASAGVTSATCSSFVNGICVTP